ncbi:MAG: HMA2 domain-containing protein [Methylobacter sp.]
MTGHKSHPYAFIKHQLPGRVRLKIPQKKGDRDYFDRLAKLFAGFPGITQLQFNPAAASVLICHDGGEVQFEPISEFAQENSLFSIAGQDEESLPVSGLTIAELASEQLNQFDQALKEMSLGLVDTRSMLMLVFAGMAVHQIGQRKIMTPAVSLLWGAIELLREDNLIAARQHVSV